VLTLIIALILYVRIRVALHSKKQYLAVNTKMLSDPTPSEYTATLTQVVGQLNRLFRAIKSALCRRNQRGRQESVYISTKTKVYPSQ
jgi:hypothetical protein